MTDHVKLAQGTLDAVHYWQEREGETDATLLTVAIEAQVHATLALAERVVKAEEEITRLDAVVTAVRDLADRWERGATRWENPLPIPEEVHQLRRALDGVDR